MISMRKKETMHAAQVMIASLDGDAIIEYRVPITDQWRPIKDRSDFWDWANYDYRITKQENSEISDIIIRDEVIATLQQNYEVHEREIERLTAANDKLRMERDELLRAIKWCGNHKSLIEAIEGEKS